MKLLSVKPNPKVLFQNLNNEAALLDSEANHYYGLDNVGARIWELLEEYSSAEKAIEKLLEEYEVGEDALRKDVYDLIEKLEKANLLFVER